MGSFITSHDIVTNASTVIAGDTGLQHIIYVGVSGDLEVVPYGQTGSVTFTAVPVGWFQVLVSEIKVAGTTATNLIKGQ